MSKIILVGPMGAGKSTIGKKLAAVLGFEFADTDHKIVRDAGVDIAWIFDKEGELGYKQREYKVFNELIQRNNIVIATGGTILSSSHIYEKLLQHKWVINLRLSLSEQFSRTIKDQNRPQLSEKKELYRLLEKYKADLDGLFNSVTKYHFNSDSMRADAVVDKIVNLVKG